tara:strand:- start:501 stop:980 length:480 start_codon:yes stop_codon:yes gene_type:complete
MNMTLNTVEQSLATLAGMHRMLQNIQNGTNYSKKRNISYDINGAGGEIAVAKYFKVYPDLSTGPHRRGHDLTVNEHTIDVKATTYNPGYLQCKTYKQVADADWYILVHANFPEFRILGGAPAEELLQDHNIKDMGYGPVYHLEQSQLCSINRITSDLPF